MTTTRKATFIMERKGTLRFCGDMQKRLFDAYVRSLPEGQVVEVSVRRHRHDKTSPQLGYWYAVLMPFAARELIAAGHNTLFDVAVGPFKTGVATTDYTADLLFKTLYGAHVGAGMVLKRTMTKEEMGKLIDFTLMWLAENLGAVAPQPEK